MVDGYEVEAHRGGNVPKNQGRNEPLSPVQVMACNGQPHAG